jgi:hypothetical protein
MKRGRPAKRPLEANKLIDAFSQLTKSQLHSLDNTTWSTRSSNTAPTVWGIMCASLKLKDNEKNRKWLARVWQTNMWLVADEVRKYVT